MAREVLIDMNLFIVELLKMYRQIDLNVIILSSIIKFLLFLLYIDVMMMMMMMMKIMMMFT
jgi:hypothetical protein